MGRQNEYQFWAMVDVDDNRLQVDLWFKSVAWSAGRWPIGGVLHTSNNRVNFQNGSAMTTSPVTLSGCYRCNQSY